MSILQASNPTTGSTTSVVTGAFGFSGRHIAEKLLRRGGRVITLTNHPQADSPLYGKVYPCPLNFADPRQLVRSMRGASVLYNTYWVRFAHGESSHELAVRNTKTLLRAAEEAGLKRIVHVSITNPTADSPLSYFRGKAELEEAIRRSGMSHAILRPAVLFGNGDILINNIAYLLRRFPLFAIPGSGKYRLQPIFVEDLADLAVASGFTTESFTVDAIGPESYSYEELVRLLRDAIGSRPWIVRMRPTFIRQIARLLGAALNDVVLTDDEIEGLMAGLLSSLAPPVGSTSLREWLRSNAPALGQSYHSELGRHFSPS